MIENPYYTIILFEILFLENSHGIHEINSRNLTKSFQQECRAFKVEDFKASSTSFSLARCTSATRGHDLHIYSCRKFRRNCPSRMIQRSSSHPDSGFSEIFSWKNQSRFRFLSLGCVTFFHHFLLKKPIFLCQFNTKKHQFSQHLLFFSKLPKSSTPPVCARPAKTGPVRLGHEAPVLWVVQQPQPRNASVPGFQTLKFIYQFYI